MKIESGQTLLFIGDSITDAGRTGQFPPFGHGWMAFFRALLMARRPDLALNFVNKGISGNTVRDLDARWEVDVVQEKPDHLFVMIGINDVWRSFATAEQQRSHVPLAEFIATYEGLLERAKRAGVNSICLLGCFFIEPNRKEPMRHLCDDYNAAVEGLAAGLGHPFISSQAAMDRLLVHQHPMAVAADRVHPDIHGHMALAEAVYEVLQHGPSA